MNYYSSEGAAGKSCYPNFNLLVVGEIYEVKIKNFYNKKSFKNPFALPAGIIKHSEDVWGGLKVKQTYFNYIPSAGRFQFSAHLSQNITATCKLKHIELKFTFCVTKLSVRNLTGSWQFPSSR